MCCLNESFLSRGPTSLLLNLYQRISFLLDINECIDGVCQHHCINLPGGYVCKCLDGFELDANSSRCEGKLVLPIKSISSKT